MALIGAKERDTGRSSQIHFPLTSPDRVQSRPRVSTLCTRGIRRRTGRGRDPRGQRLFADPVSFDQHQFAYRCPGWQHRKARCISAGVCRCDGRGRRTSVGRRQTAAGLDLSQRIRRPSNRHLFTCRARAVEARYRVLATEQLCRGLGCLWHFATLIRGACVGRCRLHPSQRRKDRSGGEGGHGRFRARLYCEFRPCRTLSVGSN